MANPRQRASMREGPLAALFRKTELNDAGGQEPDAESRPEAQTADQTSEQDVAEAPAADQPAAKGSSEAQAAESGTETGAAGAGDQTVAKNAAEARAVESSPSSASSRQEKRVRSGRLGGAPPKVGGEGSPARSTAPHPSLLPPMRANQDHSSRARQTSLDEDERGGEHVLSPKERLLHAFSSEIPANVMDRLEPVSAAARMRGSQHLHHEPAASPTGRPVIRVVGVGGAGTNAVNRMVEAEVEGVEFIAVNTDLQSLQQCNADLPVHIGVELTRGLGSGSDAEVGRQAAMDDYDKVKALLKGSDMIFIAAGAGGGTGTGAAPIIARIAKEVGALTVAIVTRPFGFEGSRRAEQANRGIQTLADEVDTLIVVPNNRLLSILDKQTSMVEAFRVADDVLRQGVQGISDLVTLPGLINLDFADVRTIMSDAGNALLGIGMGFGENRAVDAAMQAVASPLLETSMDGARSILLSITGGKDLSLWEVNEAAKAVSEAAHRDANIIFGAMVDEKLEDQVWVTVVATGYHDRPSSRRLQEPAGEPLVSRAHSPRVTDRRRGRRGALGVDEYEIPEFLPRV